MTQAYEKLGPAGGAEPAQGQEPRGGSGPGGGWACRGPEPAAEVSLKEPESLRGWGLLSTRWPSLGITEVPRDRPCIIVFTLTRSLTHHSPSICAQQGKTLFHDQWSLPGTALAACGCFILTPIFKGGDSCPPLTLVETEARRCAPHSVPPSLVPRALGAGMRSEDASTDGSVASEAAS